MLGPEQIYDRIVKKPVRGECRELTCGIVPEQFGAVEGRDLPASCVDDRDESRDIVDLQFRLGSDIEHTLGHHHVGPEIPVATLAPRGAKQAVE